MPTESQIQEATRRQRLVQQVTALEKRGLSQNQAARELGEPSANLSRYRRAFAAGGFDALIPKFDQGGRNVKYELTQDEARALRLKVLRKGSVALGVEYFAEDAQCRPETRALILAELDRAARERVKPVWPLSLRRAGRPTEDEEMLFRGPKHFGEVEFCVRRGAFWYDENGDRRPLEAGDIYESDDMSINEPFRYVHPETGRIEIGRQTLCSMDVLSAAWLGGTPVGRFRDAYRVEDIMDHLLAIVQTHGLPLIWRLERGVWENQAIDGVKLPGMKDGERWGGLEALFGIARTFKSRGKGLIESSFNPLQNHLAHESTEIGRSRGEFEAATKKLTRLANLKDEAERGRVAQNFWDIAAAADGLAGAMQRMNARPRQRRIMGRALHAPDDLRAGAVVRPCPADQLWRFCPVKRAATVRGGHVELLVEHYPLPFRFQINGVAEGGNLYFEHGYQVLVAFHPGRPEEGCHVFNAEDGSRNREGFAFAEPLLLAPLASDAPQLSVRPDQREFAARRNANAAVRTEFRAVEAVGATPARTSAAQDGWGARAEVRGGRGDAETRRRGERPVVAPRHQRSIAPEPTLSPEELEEAEREFREREWATL